MGLVASCAESIACCCGTAACGLCCRSCPSCTNSTSTRIMYAVVFFLSAVAAWTMLDPEVTRGLMKMEKYVGTASCNRHDDSCREAWSNLGVLRVMFSVCLFHVFLGLVMIGVKSSRDARAGLQNGLWVVKLLLLSGIMIGAFFIKNTFFIAWSWIGLVGAFLFILVQLVLLVDFSHSWNESWVGKMEDGSSCAKWGLFSAVFVLYGGALALTIISFLNYTKSDDNSCHQSKFILGFNIVLGVLATVASVHPRVQEAIPTSGVLQSGVVTFYSTYLAWSAVSGVPSESSSTAAIVIGALITFIAVAYSSIRTSSHTQLGKLGLNSSSTESAILVEDAYDSDDEEARGQKVVDNEKSGVAYSWTFFHITFAFAALYLMEILTEWSTFKDGHAADVRIGQGWAAVWVQAVSSWLAVILYLWTLVAPVILSDRDFGY